tara:strand:+ start:1194 stop:2600 length:1407 start_codon:yes stop_codon:yes gene_type:complete
MNRRDFLLSSASLAGGFALKSSLFADSRKASTKNSKKPNVLFLMSDEHDPKVLGCYGDSLIESTHLDQLAKQGHLFSSAYCQNPICVPSRASIVTGRFPSKVGVFGNAAEKEKKINGEPVTLGNVFRDAGYRTEWLGKEHWGGDNEGLGFGQKNVAVNRDIKASKKFRSLRKKVGRLPQNADIYDFSTDLDEDSIVADHAIQFLSNESEQPFFLGVSFRKPHFPFLVHNKYYDAYKDKVPLPRVTQGMIDDLPTQNLKHREKYKVHEMSDSQTQKARDIYYGMIGFIDDQVGRILSKLDECGLREDTIIVYISDHGEMAGEHGLWYKNAFYEASAAVPMIWSYPKVLDQNKKHSAHTMLLDVFPTLCDLCSISKPDVLEGKSLLPILKGNEDGAERVAISETYSNPKVPGRMVRKKDFKYIYFTDGKRQLFNISKDPAEEFNLVKNPEYKEIVHELHEICLKDFISPS